MSSYEFDQSEAIEGAGGYLTKAGTFHLILSTVDPEPTTKDGKPIDGLRVSGEVLDGTETSEVGKEFEFILWPPKPTDKNGGEMAKRKLTRFSYATGFIASHAPGQKVVIDCEACEGRQIIAKFSETTKEDGKKRLELNYSDIYHVDDPAVAEVPKSADAIAAIPKALRKAVQPVAAKPAAKTNKALATAGAPSLDDL